jgi:Family of unknown function (DUF6252)
MKKISAFLFITICLTACNWLPPSPNEPFYCKVNGKNFRPEKDTSPIGGVGSNPLNVTVDERDGSITIYVRNNPYFVGITLIPENKQLQKGIFKVDQRHIGTFSPDRTATIKEYITANSGEFEITKIENKLISGTFEFTCKSLNSGKEYKITKGCFNKLTYY